MKFDASLVSLDFDYENVLGVLKTAACFFLNEYRFTQLSNCHCKLYESSKQNMGISFKGYSW